MITIDYHRPPDRIQRFEQRLVHRGDRYVVTLLEAAALARPSRVAGATILEPGSPIVWFTYPGRWHDIGRFHLADGTFTGIYANILTPVAMAENSWETTDLFLDLWLQPGGPPTLLDEDEFEHATRAGWIDAPTAAAARAEARSLLLGAESGAWPGEEVHHWTLDRILASP